MGYLLAVWVSAGIIAGLFAHLVFVANVLNIIAWISFAAEACFFAAGGKNEGLLKGIASNLSGVIWASFIFFLANTWKSPYSMGIAVFIAVVMMCVQAKFNLLSFIPGAFVGAASLFGTASLDLPSGNLKAVVIAIILGGIMGWFAEQGAALLLKIIPVKSSPIHLKEAR